MTSDIDCCRMGAVPTSVCSGPYVMYLSQWHLARGPWYLCLSSFVVVGSKL